MRLLRAYRLRLHRKNRQVRAWLRRGEMQPVSLRHDRVRRRDILLFCVLRNELARLPHFLDYYRALGVGHFFFVDNGSADGTATYLTGQPDVSLWHTQTSYKRARYGIDWLNHLLSRHGKGHWCLTVDCDEFLVYPHMDSRPLAALTDWLDASHRQSFPALLLDMYPETAPDAQTMAEGQDPFDILTHFDAGNYSQRRNGRLGNLWVQGGPRQRAFFANDPQLAPALNKIPLVRWKWGHVYESSTHMLLPRGLNLTYATDGGEQIAGALLHAKFLPDIADRAREEMFRGEHYAASREYRAYENRVAAGTQFFNAQSTRYRDWRQLDELGLISAGGWL